MAIISNVADRFLREHVVVSNTIDFSAHSNYYEIGSSQAISYTNDRDGSVTTIVVKNTAGSAVTITFPANHKWAGGTVDNVVPGGEVWAFTVIKTASQGYLVAVLKELA